MYQILYIDIHINNIGDEGAKAIAQALTYNNTLTYINIWNNKIGDEGRAILEKNKRKELFLREIN